MLTVLWKIDEDREEVYLSPFVALIPAKTVKHDGEMDCGGRRHLSFQRLDGYGMTHTLVDCGDVFVMNTEGKTVARYSFGTTDNLKRAA